MVSRYLTGMGLLFLLSACGPAAPPEGPAAPGVATTPAPGSPAAPAPASPAAPGAEGSPAAGPPPAAAGDPMGSLLKVGDEGAYRASVLELLARKDNPLKLEEADYKELAELLLQIDTSDNELTFARTRIFEALTPEQRARAAEIPDQESPEGTFLEKAPAVISALEAKAPSPAPAGKVPAEFTPGIEADLFPSRLAVLLEQLAPSLTPEQAGRILPEFQRMVPAAEAQQTAWTQLTSLLHRGARGEELLKLLPEKAAAPKKFNMGNLLDGATRVVWVEAGWPEDGPPDQT